MTTKLADSFVFDFLYSDKTSRFLHLIRSDSSSFTAESSLSIDAVDFSKGPLEATIERCLDFAAGVDFGAI
jgi:hypothetical protein